MFDVCFATGNSGHYAHSWSYVLSHWKARNTYALKCKDNPWPEWKGLKTASPILTADELPDLPLVLLAPEDGRFYQGNESLKDFVHPPECIYLFGPDNLHISSDEMGSRVPDHIVYIPTGSHDEMYSYMAAAVTLYDRALKHG